MELYKLRYNLYNYLIHNTTNYESNTANKNIWFYGLISYYTFFTFMLILNYNNINLSTIIFIIIGIFFLYYCYLLDIALTNIIENPNFKDYVSLYTLLNAIFIESYKSNNINYLIHDIIKSDYDLTLNNIIYNTSYYTPITITPASGITYTTIGQPETLEILNTIGQQEPSILRKIDSTNYAYLTFTSGTYTLNIQSDLICDILLVGGGGSGGVGGGFAGGGGGAGALIYLQNKNLEVNTYIINIGEGGVHIDGNSNSDDGSSVGNNGQDTTIKNLDKTNKYVAKGGGGGGSCIKKIPKIDCNKGYSCCETNKNGNIGGSSGGSSFNDVNTVVSIDDNLPKGKAGNHGGSGYVNPKLNVVKYRSGGGGGGAGSAGGNSRQSGTYGGNGGNGLQNNITGIEQYYAAGGGGGGSGGMLENGPYVNYGLGGNSIGGNGGNSDIGFGRAELLATNGTINTGSGGGGGGFINNINGKSGAGGSGIVIIKFQYLENIIVKENNNEIIIATKYNSVFYLKINSTTHKYLLIIVNDTTEHHFIEYLIKKYNNFMKIIYKLDIPPSSLKKKIGNYYLIDIDELNKKTKPELYRLLVEYLRFKNKISATQKITEKTSLSTLLTIDGNTNTYLNKYYDTLTTINTVIQNNDNISMDDMSTYIDELVKNKDVLKYIDVYSEAYDYLKKYIYIKYDETNEIYKYISDNYEANKDNKVSILKDNLEIVGDVIIKITVKPAIVDYIIDIKTINIYLNDKTKNTSHVNSYISKIYEYLIAYLNKTYDLQITNFDALYKENKNIDLIVKAKVDLFIYLFNIIIAIVIIILTVVMHVFYIQLYNPIKLFNL